MPGWIARWDRMVQQARDWADIFAEPASSERALPDIRGSRGVNERAIVRELNDDGRAIAGCPAIRDRAGDARMAARRMLVSLALGTEGRRDCGTACNGHSNMRTLQ